MQKEKLLKWSFAAIEYPLGWKSKVYKTPFMIDENEGEPYWARLGEDCVLDSIVICDVGNQQAYVTFVNGYRCTGPSQFDVKNDEGEALEDIATLFECRS